MATSPLVSRSICVLLLANFDKEMRKARSFYLSRQPATTYQPVRFLTQSPRLPLRRIARPMLSGTSSRSTFTPSLAKCRQIQQWFHLACCITTSLYDTTYSDNIPSTVSDYVFDVARFLFKTKVRHACHSNGRWRSTGMERFQTTNFRSTSCNSCFEALRKLCSRPKLDLLVEEWPHRPIL